MTKCLDWASYQAALACVPVATTAAATHHLNSLFMRPPFSRAKASKLSPERKALFRGVFLEEAVGVHVDADSHLCAPFYLCKPVADHVLDVEGAAGVDEEALTMSSAEHRQGSRGRAEHRHAFDLWSGMADTARDGFGFG